MKKKKIKSRTLISMGLVFSALILTLAFFITMCLYTEDEEPYLFLGMGLAGLSTPLQLVWMSVLISSIKDDETEEKEDKNVK
jgi:hypothetical protein